MKQACLYDRLGGASAIDAAAELFCCKVLADPALASYFGGTDMNRQIGKQAAFLTMVLGGPTSLTGADLRTAHAALPRLNDWHFDRVIGHLGTTLRELGAAEPDIAAAGAIAESTREQVLNR
jgi:truncated hemoglobin YjbI